jgi:aspartyl-tRNA(Asn)/glutamyl-tRNA(Gln) amidotransferase subunit B
MTPSEYELNSELIEREINHLMAYHSIKMQQIKEKPQMVGWAVGQIMKSLKGHGSPKLVCDLVSERLWPNGR